MRLKNVARSSAQVTLTRLSRRFVDEAHSQRDQLHSLFARRTYLVLGHIFCDTHSSRTHVAVCRRFMLHCSVLYGEDLLECRCRRVRNGTLLVGGLR